MGFCFSLFIALIWGFFVVSLIKSVWIINQGKFVTLKRSAVRKHSSTRQINEQKETKYASICFSGAFLSGFTKKIILVKKFRSRIWIIAS